MSRLSNCGCWMLDVAVVGVYFVLRYVNINMDLENRQKALAHVFELKTKYVRKGGKYGKFLGISASSQQLVQIRNFEIDC